MSGILQWKPGVVFTWWWTKAKVSTEKHNQILRKLYITSFCVRENDYFNWNFSSLACSSLLACFHYKSLELGRNFVLCWSVSWSNRACFSNKCVVDSIVHSAPYVRLASCLTEWLFLSTPVIQRMDSTVHLINYFSLDNSLGYGGPYPMDIDVSDWNYYITFGSALRCSVYVDTYLSLDFRPNKPL